MSRSKETCGEFSDEASAGPTACFVAPNGTSEKQANAVRRSRIVFAVFAFIIQISFQPLRYLRWISGSISGAFFARRFLKSHSSFLPALNATLPRWFASVNQPAYSKLQVVGAPVLQA